MPKIVPLVLVLVVLPLMGCATQLPFQAGDRAATTAPVSQARMEALRLVDARRFAEAQAMLQPLLAANPVDAEVKLALGECALGLGKLDDAGPLFASLVNDPALRPRALQGLGITLMHQGDAEGAAGALQQATEADPSLWRAWNGLAQAYDFQHQWDQSRTAYEKALQTAPNTAIIYNNLGMSLLAQDRFDEAIESFGEARTADPSLTIVETNRQLALAMQQRYPEATFATAPEEKAKLLNNAGYVALMKGDYDRAERFFVQAAETSPTYYAPAHENLEILKEVRAKAQDKSS